MVAPYDPRYFDLFMKDDEGVQAVGTKKAQMEDLKDLSIPFDQAMG